jgi:NTE family protein
VIQVLEEHGIEIDVIVGASMGAYVGALWAAGYDGRELQAFASEIRTPRDLWGRLDFALPPVRGLFHGHAVIRRLTDSLEGVTFAELSKELHVVAANLDTYERRIFSAGDVATAVHASSAIPGICVPVVVEGHRYVDGGIVDPLPVGVLAGVGCDQIIAVNVIPSFEEIELGLTQRPRKRPIGAFRSTLRKLNSAVNVFAEGNVVDIMRRSVLCAEIRMAHTSARRANVVVQPRVQSLRWHDYHRYLQYIEVGRRAAEAQLPALLALSQPRKLNGEKHEVSPTNRLVAHIER